MKIVFASAVAFSAALTASAASAAEPTPTGVELGFRTGYGIPLGKASGSSATNPNGSNLSELYSGQIPLWFDAGYRFLPQVYVGAFFQYGFALINNNATTGCGQNGVSCSGNDLMLGVDAHYHFLPDGQFDPWAGIGFGYEWANTSASAGSVSSSGQIAGLQFVNFQAGGDYKVLPNFGVGPFVTLSLGQYDTASVTVGAQTVSGDVQNKELHEWLTFGVRGAYDINL
jgi:outer membrane protein W